MIDTIPFQFRARKKKTQLRLLKFSKLHQTKNYVVHNTTHSVPNYHKKSLPNINITILIPSLLVFQYNAPTQN